MSYEPKKIFDVIDAWVTELSLAPMGHNHRKYLLVKAGNNMGPKELKALLSEEDPELTQVLEKAGLFDESLEAGVVIGKLLKAYGDELPEGFLSVLAKATGLDVPELDDGEGEEGEGKKPMKKATEPAEGAGEGPKNRPEDLLKKLEKADPDMRDFIMDLHKAATGAEARAKAAEAMAMKLEKAQTEAYFERLIGDLKGLPGDLKPLKKALMAINSQFPVETGFITTTLKKASDLAIKGLGQAGTQVQLPGSEAGPAEQLIRSKAAQIMKKAPDMSEEEAMALVLEKAPELYEQYIAERGGA